MSNAARARIEWALIAAGVIVFAACLDFRISSDADQRFRDLRQLMRQQSLSVSPYSLFGPLLASPFYLLGQDVETSRFWVARFNFAVFLAALAVMWRLTRRHTDPDLARRFVLLMLAASVFPAHARDFFGEMVTVMLASIGLLLLTLETRVGGAVLLGLSAVNQPGTVIAVGLATARHVLTHRRLRVAVAAAVPLLLIAVENTLRRGSPFLTGYEGAAGAKTLMPYSGLAGFSYPFALGVLSILLSFGKGLLFFMPGLLLPVGRALREVRWAFLAYLAGLILLYAKWWSWYGGWVWGPRFFAIGSALACLAMADAIGSERGTRVRLLVAVVVAWSAWVSVNGTVFELHTLQICLDNYQHQFEFLCWYVPEFSPLFRPFVVDAPIRVRDAALLAFHGVAALWLVAPLVRAAASELRQRRAGALAAVRAGWRW